MNKLAGWKVSVVAMSGMTFELETPHGRMMATMLAGIAQFERDLLSEGVVARFVRRVTLDVNKYRTLTSSKIQLSHWHKSVFHVAPFSFCQRFRFKFCGSENWRLQNERFKDNIEVGSLAVRKELKPAPKAVSKPFCPQNKGPTFYGLC